MGRLKNVRDTRVGKNGTMAKGVMIYSPFGDIVGGGTGQKLDEVGTTQYYDIGTRYVTGDGRVYRYAKAAGTLIPGQGCMPPAKQLVAYRSIAAVVTAGSNVVSLTITTDDGATGVIATNELKGGYIVIFDATSTNLSTNRMIVSNVATTGAGTLTLTLDDGVPLALTTSDFGECMASPYKDIVVAASEVRGVVGIPCVAATSGQYLWIQTWGVCWIATQLDAGTALMDRQLVFRHDGSCDKHDYADAKNGFAQHAGFMLQNGVAAETPTQGAPFIMLQISI